MVALSLSGAADRLLSDWKVMRGGSNLRGRNYPISRYAREEYSITWRKWLFQRTSNALIHGSILLLQLDYFHEHFFFFLCLGLKRVAPCLRQ